MLPTKVHIKITPSWLWLSFIKRTWSLLHSQSHNRLQTLQVKIESFYPSRVEVRKYLVVSMCWCVCKLDGDVTSQYEYEEVSSKKEKKKKKSPANLTITRKRLACSLLLSLCPSHFLPFFSILAPYETSL